MPAMRCQQPRFSSTVNDVNNGFGNPTVRLLGVISDIISQLD